MRRRTRHLATFGVLAFAAFGVTACGSSNEVVARVAGVGTITKGAVEHWIPIEARLVYATVPKRPVPEGAVPTPPSYTACIAYLNTLARRPQEASQRPTTAQLKENCAKQYAQLKQTVLNLLVGWNWIVGDGAAAGMHVTDAQARQRIAEDEKTELLGVPLEKYLKYTGQTLADVLLRDKVQLLKVKLQQKLLTFAKSLPKSMTERQRLAAVAGFERHMRTPTQWIALTSCSPGWVSPSCKQYKGPQASGTSD
jgi:hypothetical protein